MPWCPSCKIEYRDGFSVCSDCGVPLTEECPQDAKHDPASVADEQISVELLIETGNSVEADMIAAMLESENIRAMKKSSGPGGYMKLYMGMTVFGVEIYVSSEDYVRAKELLEGYFEGSAPESGNDEAPRRYKVVRDKKSIDPVNTAGENRNTGLDFEKRKRVLRTIFLIAFIPGLLIFLLAAFMMILSLFELW